MLWASAIMETTNEDHCIRACCPVIDRGYRSSSQCVGCEGVLGSERAGSLLSPEGVAMASAIAARAGGRSVMAALFAVLAVPKHRGLEAAFKVVVRVVGPKRRASEV